MKRLRWVLGESSCIFYKTLTLSSFVGRIKNGSSSLLSVFTHCRSLIQLYITKQLMPRGTLGCRTAVAAEDVDPFLTPYFASSGIN